MTDPIRPFINFIESIANAGAAKTHETASPKKVGNQQNSSPSSGATALTFSERLAARLAVIDRNDRKRRRQAFVELALLSELGEQLVLDHAMAELVDKVTSIIATDRQMAAELDLTLDNVEYASRSL